MTKATSDTTKLNFITDQGSTRATVRCACRAVRLVCGPGAFFAAPRAAAGLSAVAWPAPGDDPALGAEGFPAVAPERRNVRAGDDDECDGGSGISHANAAGETDGGSACTGRVPARAMEPACEAGPEAEAGAAPEAAVPLGSSPAGFTAD